MEFPVVERSLNAGQLAYISGSSNQSGTKGHGWVIDANPRVYEISVRSADVTVF